MKIQSKNLAESLIAVLAIWLLVRQIPDYTSLLLTLASTDSEIIRSKLSGYALKIQSVHFFVSIITGVLLFSSRRFLGSWLGCKSDSEISSASLLAVGVAAIGVYYFISGTLTLINYFLIPSGYDQPAQYTMFLGLASIFLGVLTFLMSTNVSKLWLLIRGRV